MTTVTLRFDDAMKKELDEMVEEMGMNLTTFLPSTQSGHCEIGRFPLKSVRR